MRNFTLYMFILGILLLPARVSAAGDIANSEYLSQIIKNEKVTLDFNNASLSKILREIMNQTTIGFSMDESAKKVDGLSINVKDKSVEVALETLFEGINYDYELKGNTIAVYSVTKSAQPLVQQPEQITIIGKVVDVKGKPIAGATVLVEGTQIGAITDADGAFTFAATKGAKLNVTFTGYLDVTKEITSESMTITMQINEMIVDDVVVTGYFEKKKETYTGAVTQFSGVELRTVTTGNMLSALSMLDPSFVTVDNNVMGSNPNAIPEFEIRGSSSIKGQFEGNPNMPTFILDGFEVDVQKVYDLDPNRVKSMTILKDASATAIYGSRAANGVVVIETIAPHPGELRISYSGSLDLELADLSSYNFMNAAEKVEYERRAGLFEPLWGSSESWDDSLLEYNEKLKLVAEGYDTEWYKMPVKDVGVGQKHAVNVQGGTEEFRYGIDVYYSNKQGVLKGSDRNSYGASITFQYNLDKLRFSNYASFDHVKGVNSPYGTYSGFTLQNPYYYPYDENGNISPVLYEFKEWGLSGTLETIPVYNPLYNTTLPSIDESISNSFINNFSVEYDFTSELKFKGSVALGLDFGRTDLYKSNEHTDFIDIDRADRGSYNYSSTESFSYDVNLTLSYNKMIGKHNINGGLVYNAQQTNSDALSLNIIGFPNINMSHLGMGTQFPDGSKPSGDYSITRLLGVAFNGSYTYDNKYLFDFSARSDASSMFGSNNRWGTFWSLGLGWNIHKENFMATSNVFNELKLRGSVGTTGGQNFSPYQAMSIFSYQVSGSYDGYVGTRIMGYGNEDLKWQVTNKNNIGLDFSLLNNRFSGSVNAYSDVSNDVLIDVSLAPILGFSTFKQNLGKIKNSGYEVSLRGSIINDVKRDFIWNVTFNAVHNKNQVLEINDALNAFNESQDEAYEDEAKVGKAPTVRYAEGLSQNTIWANESLGIDPRTGEEVFLDMDGNITDEWSTANYKPLGNTDPMLFGNFGTQLIYKGFELGVNAYYRFGGQIYNNTLVDKIENISANYNADVRVLTDRWSKPGDVAMFKAATDFSQTNPTSRFIEDENYIQLQSLSLGYNIYGDKLSRYGIERIKVSAIGNDIFTISTVKMERGTAYPFARTISLALQVTF